MGGIHIPSTDRRLLALFPTLDPAKYNPSLILGFKGPTGIKYLLRFVYYNNRLHQKGTRNEYRLTGLTVFMRFSNAKIGDRFCITSLGDGEFEMEIKKPIIEKQSSVIKLIGWNQVC